MCSLDVYTFLYVCYMSADILFLKRSQNFEGAALIRVSLLHSGLFAILTIFFCLLMLVDMML